MGGSRSPRRERSRDRARRRYRDRSRDRERAKDKERDGRRDRDWDRGGKRREYRDRSKDRRRHPSKDRDRSKEKVRDFQDRPLSSRNKPSAPAARGYSPPPLTPSGAAARLASGSNNALPPPKNPNGPTSTSDAPPADKERPNFSSTGLLAAAANTTATGAVLKYHEPSDARLPPPSPAYKLFIFKDAAIVDTIELGTRSCWLIGRDRAVADLPVDHPSCSKQHAVLQFRHVAKTDEFGEKKAKVRLYLCDLESANGTMLGDVEVEGGRFVECREGDLIRLGTSTREYVIMLDRG